MITSTVGPVRWENLRSDDSDEYDGGVDLDDGLLDPEDSLVNSGVSDFS